MADQRIRRAAGCIELSTGVITTECREMNRFRLLVMCPHPTEGSEYVLDLIARDTPAYATSVAVIVHGEKMGLTWAENSEAMTARVVEVLDSVLGPLSERAGDLAVTEFGFESAVERYWGILVAV